MRSPLLILAFDAAEELFAAHEKMPPEAHFRNEPLRGIVFGVTHKEFANQLTRPAAFFGSQAFEFVRPAKLSRMAFETSR